MDITLKISSSSLALPKFSYTTSHLKTNFELFSARPFSRNLPNSSVSRSPSQSAVQNALGDVHKRSSLESLFCYDKAIPEERIEEPTGLSLAKKNVGDKPHCPGCDVKGAILCTTCSGSGLYIDSIMESQGIIVKVRCLDVIMSCIFVVFPRMKKWKMRTRTRKCMLVHSHGSAMDHDFSVNSCNDALCTSCISFNVIFT